jgi:hypothetical protein
VPNYSEFSEIVNASPFDETHPSKPSGLRIIDRTYTSLTLEWSANPEGDVIGYNIYRSESSAGSYSQIGVQPIDGTTFINKELNESTIYYFKIKAVDDAGLLSLFSDYATGMTLTSFQPPQTNKSFDIIEILEDNIDRKEIKLFDYFWDPNNDILEFRAEGQNNITVFIKQENGSVILYPKLNWNGNETITFFAYDGLFESSINISIFVASVNDPPKVPVILYPESGIEIEEGDSLNFIGECDDPDLIYGDNLDFYWYSHIQGKLGEGKELRDIILQYGQHLVTLEVYDRMGESNNVTIYISVAEEKEEPEEKNSMDWFYDYALNLILGVILVIMLIIIFFDYFKKKRANTFTSKKELSQRDDTELIEE